VVSCSFTNFLGASVVVMDHSAITMSGCSVFGSKGVTCKENGGHVYVEKSSYDEGTVELSGSCSASFVGMKFEGLTGRSIFKVGDGSTLTVEDSLAKDFQSDVVFDVKMGGIFSVRNSDFEKVNQVLDMHGGSASFSVVTIGNIEKGNRAISIHDSSTLFITSSRFDEISSSRSGSAIYVSNSQLSLLYSSFECFVNITSDSDGGAIAIEGEEGLLLTTTAVITDRRR